MIETTRTDYVDRCTPATLSAMVSGWDTMALALPAQVTARLTRLSRVECVDVTTVMLAAWGLLLGTRQDGPDIGFSYLDRSRPPKPGQATPLEGLHARPVPLRLRIVGDLRLSAWLREIQRHLVAHEVRGPMTLAGVRPGSDTPCEAPGLRSLVVVQGAAPCAAPTSIGWSVPPDAEVHGGFTLTLTVFLGEHMGLQLRGLRTRFSTEPIEALLGRLERALTSMARGGTQKLASIASHAGNDEWNPASPAAGPTVSDFRFAPPSAGRLSL